MARGIQTRAETARAPSRYRPPSTLEIPDNLPPGFVYRWLRVRIKNDDDDRNVYRRQREGWEFIKKEDVPGYIGPAHQKGAFTGVIGQTDLVLAKLPEDIAEDRRRYYHDITAGANEAIETELRAEEHKAAPISRTFKTAVSGGSRKPAFGE